MNVAMREIPLLWLGIAISVVFSKFYTYLHTYLLSYRTVLAIFLLHVFMGKSVQ